ncbi:MAG: signal peptidase II [Solirubrobacteraceae bacterium]
MSARASWARAAAVFACILLADQAVKALVTSSLARGEEREVLAGIKLVNVRNSGVAFGQLQNGGAIVAAVIAIAVLALLVYFSRHGTRPWMWLPTGLLLGGALGNIVDRLREGAVIDFIKLPYWPPFNVADSAIVVGVVVLLFVIDRDDGAARPA